MTRHDETPGKFRHGKTFRAAALAACAALGACSDKPLMRPALLGTYAWDAQARQIANADRDSFVMYRREWLMAGALPGPDGESHLREIARRLALLPDSVIIDRSDDARLDQARREYVVNYLAEHGIASAAQRVVVGHAMTPGMSGTEAIDVNDALPKPGTSGTSGAGGASGVGGGLLGGGAGMTSGGY